MLRLSLVAALAVPLLLWACSSDTAAKDDASSSSSSSGGASGDDDPPGDDDQTGDDDDQPGASSGAGASSSSSSSSSSGDPGPGPSQQCPYTPDADGFGTLTSPAGDYTVRVPPGYDAATAAPLRLFVALKGCGDNAANFATWAAVPYAKRATQDYLAISVGGRDGVCWKLAEDAATVTAAIEHVRSCFAVHQKQIVIGGYDSGGELALSMAMKDANTFAGVLVEHTTLSSAVGKSKVDSTLAAAAWKIPVALVAGTADLDYPIANVRADVQKIQDAGFPVDLVETADEHGGDTEDWLTLLPKMAGWSAP